MFSQLLKLFPRTEFESAVRRTGAEYAAKGFSSWSQFRDLERDGHRIQLDPRSVRDQYIQAVTRFVEQVRRDAGRMRIDYVQMNTAMPFEAALSFRNRITVDSERVAEAEPFRPAWQPQESKIRRHRSLARRAGLIRGLNPLLVVFFRDQPRQLGFVGDEVGFEARDDVFQARLPIGDNRQLPHANDENGCRKPDRPRTPAA